MEIKGINLTEFAKLADIEMQKHDFHGFEVVVHSVIKQLSKENNIDIDEKSKFTEVGVCQGRVSGNISWNEGVLYADAIINGWVEDGTKLYVKDKE